MFNSEINVGIMSKYLPVDALIVPALQLSM